MGIYRVAVHFLSYLPHNVFAIKTLKMEEIVKKNSKFPQNRRKEIKSIGKQIKLIQNEGAGFDNLDAATTGTNAETDRYSYTWFDILCNLCSMLFYMADIGTDSFLAFTYYKEERWLYFGLTIAFMTVPSVVMNIVSFFWYLSDYNTYRKKQTWGPSWILWSSFHIIFSILQLGPVLRYASSIYYGCQSRRENENSKKRLYYLLSLEEDKDSCMLRLFESSLEAGPQLILQLYILTTQKPEYRDKFHLVVQVGAIITSLVGMCWSHVAYHRALRFSRDDKAKMTIPGSILYFLWRLFEIMPRVLALSMFAALADWWVFVVAGVHWLVMTFWYCCQRRYEPAMFGKTCPFMDMGFNMICGAVEVFGFLNVREGHTRYRCLVFYAIFYSENLALSSIWFGLTPDLGLWFHFPVFFVVVLGFWIAVLFQAIYYKCFHPTGYITLCLDTEAFFESVCYKPRTFEQGMSEENVADVLLEQNSQLTVL